MKLPAPENRVYATNHFAGGYSCIYLDDAAWIIGPNDEIIAKFQGNIKHFMDFAKAVINPQLDIT